MESKVKSFKIYTDDEDKVLIGNSQELCAKHKITVSFDSLKNATPQYWANRRKNAIQIRPTKNTGYYVSALHEIGHLIGQQQNGNLIQAEIYAWVWAKQNAIVWTDTAERIMEKALMSYVKNAKTYNRFARPVLDGARA